MIPQTKRQMFAMNNIKRSFTMIWLDDANLLKNRYVFTIYLLRKLETYLSSRSLRYSIFNEIELKDWIERNKFLKILKNTIMICVFS